MDHNNTTDNGSYTQKKYVTHRRTVEVTSPFNRMYYYKKHGLRLPDIEPETSFTANIMPPSSYVNNNDRAVNVIGKFTHLSSNKVKHVIPAIEWTPEGRRLIVATYNGELSLWNGFSFNFESLMQAHDSAVTTMKYSHAGDWMVSGDADGIIKIWQPNFNMVKELDSAHTESIRDIAFCNNDSKFVSCSDDNILKIWNFSNGREERVLSGHHWDVKSCDWHPTMGLIASASKDNLVKLWDPRAGNCISTILNFKHTVLKTRFQPTKGNLLGAISKDKSLRIFDIRYGTKEIMAVKDEIDYMDLLWSPINESMLTIGSYDGSIKHFDLLQDTEKPIHTIPFAHDKCITSMAYNPMGNILASASKDRTIRFWTRARPFDPNAFDDPSYNDQKINGWYFGINNNINAVREKSEFGAAPPTLDGTTAAPGGYTAPSSTSSYNRGTTNNYHHDNNNNNNNNNNRHMLGSPVKKPPPTSGGLPGLNSSLPGLN
ncbi:similar to Saccharomyces cerevisiae YNL317W PFS2 Integral subunit of the pre-mRNA cleavage and polyadenylation factor (CPF) complex [Maudiozyma barnettii]|uniref:Polyadenylation factor subunit 2 n=1 Tax=Maudiozyma barnettii TaxID=61262 RepID=A0A8H2VK57_9SACH|nr:cleavage polyadenylation factor subunit PFS2 [Kazachstania barnettii]CAB4256814.1 similar to Saccharomyces cerevisiae YNL317W PFS2 Integral subunit of the pre-mRNA cleavage and polyadenylation factor (CPF) complex [Kazachstania barnettii]CAD1785467.1 similar to Saccharomyces cerevisiae YNL317W PFS2 Integral subunit of the pre-mRNA cleavage and polyadenylation factor (CPF) complex [Kazachstania barnettii]